jgi:hypothetical protein
MNRGKFITIEGSEGVGKTTQIAALRDSLAERGLEVIVTREPGGTPRDAHREPDPAGTGAGRMGRMRSLHGRDLRVPGRRSRCPS